MKFPSLLRRDESPPPADDDSGRTGAVATDARSDERPDVDGRTDGSAPRGRASADDTTGTDRATTGRGAGPDTSRATGDPAAGRDTDSQPAAERDAEARAATARSTVQGSRRARAGTATTTASGTGTADRDRTVDGRHATDLDRDRTVDGHRTSGLDRTLDGHRTADRDRTFDRDRSVSRDGIAGTGERDGTAVDDRTPDGDAGRDVPPAPVGPRPRASLLATLGLIVGVASVLFVLTGALAGYGIALGAVGAVLAVLGLMATRRRHIAGKSDALLGIAFGLGAVVLGVLAMTGQYDWPTTDGDMVVRFREWLDSQFVDRM